MGPTFYAGDREEPRSELGQKGMIKAQDGRKNRRTAHACGRDRGWAGQLEARECQARHTDSESWVPEGSVLLGHQYRSEMFFVPGR